MLKFTYLATDEEIMPFGGLPLVSNLVAKTQLAKRLDILPYRESSSAKISNSDIIKTMLGILAQGKADYAAVSEFEDSDYFSYAMDIKNIPSQERLRQRLDMMPSAVKDILDSESLRLLKTLNVEFSPTYGDYVPLDIDVSPFDNSNTKKEGCNCTYKIHDGFAPMFAYLGTEGYLVGTEFREGKQHSQAGTVQFLERLIPQVKTLTDKPILLRADSGNDSGDNVKLLLNHGVDFVIKKNYRRTTEQVIQHVIANAGTPQFRDEYGAKKNIYRFKEINPDYPNEEASNDNPEVAKRPKPVYNYFLVKEILETKDGQILLIPEYELEGFVSTLDDNVENMKEIYRMHGTCEQFHSEIKTDMDLERLPSGKFKTNDLILHIGMFTYNILRYIGQSSMKSPKNPKRMSDEKKMVMRRRIKSVIKDMMMLASKLVTHGRRMFIKASKRNKWFDCVGDIYQQIRFV